MNPIFNQLGAPNPFASMGMNPMQHMMNTNPGMNLMMGGAPPNNPAMMMNSMMGGGAGGMPPNMMGGGGGGSGFGGNPNFMGNPMNAAANQQNFMGQPAAPQPASSQGQNPFDLF